MYIYIYMYIHSQGFKNTPTAGIARAPVRTTHACSKPLQKAAQAHLGTATSDGGGLKREGASASPNSAACPCGHQTCYDWLHTTPLLSICSGWERDGSHAAMAKNIKEARNKSGATGVVLVVHTRLHRSTRVGVQKGRPALRSRSTIRGGWTSRSKIHLLSK